MNYTFAQYFSALWKDCLPFPWQERLCREIVAKDSWPNLGLPTSFGKTAAIDIAVWHLALEADLPPAKRRAPRRIVFLVDRREVVDAATERDEAIAQKINEATTGVLGWVAQRLKLLGGSQPLATVCLRGGVARNDEWYRDPLQPTLISSTVDQVGSRLLFRGYGCSSKTAPIHAALLSHDTLYLLDEAHLSQPFIDTLLTVQKHVVKARTTHPWVVPPQVALLTATPDSSNVFKENQDDCQHPILSRRYKVSKPAKLVKLGSKADLSGALAGAAQELVTKLGQPSPKVVVFVNSVATARSVYNLLSKQGMALLVTGRSRPLSRWKLFRQENAPGKCLYLGQDPLPPEHGPFYVVSTQSLEVGADLNFDLLVTECASLDALRQRFGRLARGGSDKPAPAIIIAQDTKGSPVYGTALDATWKWLLARGAKSKKTVDFGIAAMTKILPESQEELAPMLCQRPHAPLLLDHHIEALAQTSLKDNEPEIAVYLHGFRNRPPDVQVVWRNLPDDQRDTWTEIVDIIKPISSEAVPLPCGLLKRWLSYGMPSPCYDVEHVEVKDKDDKAERDPQPKRLRTPFVRIEPDEEEGVLCTSADDIETICPGDTIILPTTAGGCDIYGWAPNSRSAQDVSSDAYLFQRHQLCLRSPRTDDPFEDEENPKQPFLSWASLYVRPALAKALAQGATWEQEKLPDTTIVYTSSLLEPWKRSGGECLLLPHLSEVSANAYEFAQGLGLPKHLVETLTMAGLLHDLGKATPENQEAMGGSLERPLAKSTNKNRRNKLIGRHEATSVASTLRHYPQADALLCYLIDTHHGHARPTHIHTFVRDGEWGHVTVALPDKRVIRFTCRHESAHYRLEAGSVPRWMQCQKTYGPWTLALLETILRLADWKASQ